MDKGENMNIKTKYDLGQRVWVNLHGKIYSGTIRCICAQRGKMVRWGWGWGGRVRWPSAKRTEYLVWLPKADIKDRDFTFAEHDFRVFATKEAAQKQLDADKKECEKICKK